MIKVPARPQSAPTQFSAAASARRYSEAKLCVSARCAAATRPGEAKPDANVAEHLTGSLWPLLIPLRQLHLAASFRVSILTGSFIVFVAGIQRVVIIPAIIAARSVVLRDALGRREQEC